MNEKKNSLSVAINYINFSEVDEIKKGEVKNCFPSYFSDEEEVMKEECEYGMSELERLLEEYNEDERLQNYIVAKVTIMRNQCPYEGIAHLYDEFLLKLKEKYPNLDYIDKPRYSVYFPTSHFPSLRRICKALAENQPKVPEVLKMQHISNEELFALLKNIFNFYNGRIPRAEQILLWYPDYLARFFELQRVIMLEDGPIPLDWRYFIALLSVACYGCDYLYNVLLEGFIGAGGNESWLEPNSTTLPNKLKRIIDLNYNLAYNPWVLLTEKRDQLVSLLKEPDAWSRQEVVQMLTISSFYHSFCCYVFAMGLLPEFDLPRDQQKDLYIRTDDDAWRDMMKNSPLMRMTNQGILDELNKLAEENEEEKEDKGPRIKTRSDLATSEKGDDSIDYGDEFTLEGYRNIDIFQKFFGDKTAKFETCIKHRKISSDIYEWKTNGYSFLDESFSEYAKAIDQKFSYINSLTLGCFGEVQDVQTDPFRKSLLYYVHLIYGYHHLDYDYKKMNTLLHKDIKLAIKTIGSTPQNLTFGIINKFPIGFETYEICHIALLVMEAKFQVELMYGFLALHHAKH